MHTSNALSVCMLVTNFDAATGGVQRNSRLLLSELGKRGIKTFVYTRNYAGLPSNELVNGTYVQRSRVIKRSVILSSFFYLAGAVIWLIRNRHRYDLIHCQQMFGSAMAAALAGFVVRKPVVVRVTLSGHRGEVNEVKSVALAGLRLSLLGRVSKWVALSSEMKAEIEQITEGENKVTVIYNATDIPSEAAFDQATKAQFRSKLDLGNNKLVVFAGRLSEDKGLDILIAAWAHVCGIHPGSRLLLLGEGGEYRNTESETKRMVAELKLENSVSFLGHVDEVKQYILASDIFVLPSRWEGMSNALVEAFACGATIVASDIGANREICEDGINSLLFPVGDVRALATAIVKLMDEPSMAVALGKAARNKAEKVLTVDKMINSYIETYRELCSGSSSHGH